MIRVDSISIKEFRGIRDLTLSFQSQNFAVCGPNGTGKSGIVDALEFVLTGNISRLSGEGTGEISLREHGPHVDCKEPEKATVTLDLTIPNLQKSVTIQRNLGAPGTLSVSSNDQDVLDVLNHVASHPELVLSRRELIRYVLATPGRRAEEVQALLHLDRIEQVRANLQKIANSCERELPQLEATANQTKVSFLRTLGLSQMLTQELLAATNVHRTVLGLEPLTTMTSTTSLKEGIATPARLQPQRVPKVQALIDIKALREALAALTDDSVRETASEITRDLQVVAKDPALIMEVKRETFYTFGFELINMDACPLCDTNWDPVTLRKLVQAKIDHFQDVSKKRVLLEEKLTPLASKLSKAQASISGILRYAELATPPIRLAAIREYLAHARTISAELDSVLPVAETIQALTDLSNIPRDVFDAIDAFERLVAALPEPTRQDAARDWLTLAQERLDVYRRAKRRHVSAENKAKIARKVSDVFVATSDSVLASVYAQVEKDFSALYSFINRDDEGNFDAKLIPSIGKLGFDVDFYGRGFFPPGAYHSEGHQDGMGLCLYLALMRHLQEEQFTFAVLDDVLMSVDSGHRREVCALLKREFPNTQFVMTTHDPIWLRHMRTESLIGGHIQFKNWSVEHGPTEWDGQDVWAKINGHLDKREVRDAAALLRHYLEYVAAELCYRLHVPVGLRGDAQYQLGELLPPAIGYLIKLYKKAKDAANSWNQKDVVDELAARASEFSARADRLNAEKWPVNILVHFNSWDNLQSDEFRPVVDAYRQLLLGFTCAACGEYLYVTPDRESPDQVRCGCGKSSMNLIKK